MLTVIGAGFGRTGTMSLKHALQRLGHGPCYHMDEVMTRPERFGQWESAAQSPSPDWPAIFSDYRATVDWPAATYWRELAAFYPEARVILSRRDAEGWFDSTQQTIFHPKIAGLLPPPVEKMLWSTVYSLFDGKINDRARCIEVYERHNAAVIAGVPSDRLLVYEVGSGWEPLCAFLGCDVPTEDYPRLNDTAQFQAMFASAPN